MTMAPLSFSETPQMYTVPASQIQHDDLDALAPAVAHDSCGFDPLVKELMAGHSQLWRFSAVDAVGVCVTNISDTPGGRELTVWFAAGNGPHKYKHFILDTLIKYGQKTKCKKLVTQTTPSLAEYYQKTLNFTLDGVVVGMEIPDVKE